MTDRLSIRLTSLALATVVTWSLLVGIDTLALEQHSGGLQMSQVPVATVVAATATRSTKS